MTCSAFLECFFSQEKEQNLLCLEFFFWLDEKCLWSVTRLTPQMRSNMKVFPTQIAQTCRWISRAFFMFLLYLLLYFLQLLNCVVCDSDINCFQQSEKNQRNEFHLMQETFLIKLVSRFVLVGIKATMLKSFKLWRIWFVFYKDFFNVGRDLRFVVFMFVWSQFYAAIGTFDVHKKD